MARAVIQELIRLVGTNFTPRTSDHQRTRCSPLRTKTRMSPENSFGAVGIISESQRRTIHLAVLISESLTWLGLGKIVFGFINPAGVPSCRWRTSRSEEHTS